FPRCICERLDAAVILVSAAVEHHFDHTGPLGALGDELADGFGGSDVATTLQILLRFLVDRAGGNKCAPAAVVNNLCVNVSERAVHAQARPLRRAGHPGAHASVNSPALLILR